jgi:imidazole glycerol phosphate synthase glutamine amidotransferase subunit
MSADVLIVRTGAANLASVVAAFERLGRSVQTTDNAFAVRNAKRVVLPGVGAFAPVAERLRENGMGEALLYRIEEDLPTLAVCLGLHLLAAGSEEGGDAEGLGVLAVEASRFPDSVVVPQLGWNSLEADDECRMLRDGDAYFANSFRITERPPGWGVAWSEHGGPFVAAVERGSVLGCQFHPELSGAWGQALLERWLARAGDSPC